MSAWGNNRGSPDTLCPIYPPDAVLLGCERQRDNVFGLEVAFSGCGGKGTMSAAEGVVLEAK